MHALNLVPLILIDELYLHSISKSIVYSCFGLDQSMLATLIKNHLLVLLVFGLSLPNNLISLVKRDFSYFITGFSHHRQVSHQKISLERIGKVFCHVIIQSNKKEKVHHQ